MDAPSPHDLLTVYLGDHLAGASAGRARLARAARAHAGTETGRVLADLHTEVVADRRELLRWMRALQVPRRRHLQVAARVVEALGALKPNGRLVRRSPLRTVVELEALLLGVEGKAAGWRSLRELAEAGGPAGSRLDARSAGTSFDVLLERAERQAARLEELRRSAVRDVLAG
ncbi:hypothetical protein AB2L27_10535 [Kineococcus sp. LSe6-4]|uniref:DUF222 domain-containing protein n=1 Tax=Kineococcus halophytocola TaxID=3234027 RepID=A0ABV4H3D0_9ACTN